MQGSRPCPTPQTQASAALKHKGIYKYAASKAQALGIMELWYMPFCDRMSMGVQGSGDGAPRDVLEPVWSVCWKISNLHPRGLTRMCSSQKGCFARCHPRVRSHRVLH